MTTTVYGIPNCGSVKKTRDWLATNGVDYIFHDFKKQSINAVTIEQWLKTVPLTLLINKKGTTWRGLSAESQALADSPKTAIELMIQHTSVIKRPVIVTRDLVCVGHDEAALAATFLTSV